MFVANLKEIGLILTEIELLLYTRFEKVESQTGNLFTYNTRGRTAAMAHFEALLYQCVSFFVALKYLPSL